MMGDIVLLQAVGRGDSAAFTKLYGKCRPQMLPYAAGILGGDSSLAEDAVDEAFTDIWRLAGRFNTIGNASAWIRRIVRNKAIDLLRKTAGRETDKSAEFFSALEDGALNPEELSLLSDQRRWLRSALGVLNIDQREVVILCYYKGLSLQEIAHETGCPANTVKTRLFYARKKLLAWIEAEESDAHFTVLAARTPTQTTHAVL